MLIGSHDWAHPHWQSFYPDTLPADWSLTYYSNEFCCVLVPAARLGADTAADWIADTHEQFRFFLQLGADADWDTISMRAAALGSRLGGFVCDVADCTPAPALQKLTALHVPVCVDAADHPWIDAGGACPLWRPDRDVRGAPMGLVALSGETDRRALRQHVERFGRQASAAGVDAEALFFTGDGLRPETVRDAVVIAGLLGV